MSKADNMYRVKEINSIYDLGWIYVSNLIKSKRMAIRKAKSHKMATGHRVTIKFIA